MFENIKKPPLIGGIFSGRPGGNRTHNNALGGHRYIHLTTDPSNICKNFYTMELYDEISADKVLNYIL